MRNHALVCDHYIRATHRLAALELLFSRGAFADTVREAQETVELLLKALLRNANIDVPRIHDVSSLLTEHSDRMPVQVRARLDFYGEVSRQMRRDRELAFYGTEDLTPTEFYRESDAARALEQTRAVHAELAFLVGPGDKG